MIADMRVFELGDGLLVSLVATIAAAVRDRFDDLVFSEDVQVTDLSAVWSTFGLYGPGAPLRAWGRTPPGRRANSGRPRLSGLPGRRSTTNGEIGGASVGCGRATS
jgi:hypothetical protein